MPNDTVPLQRSHMRRRLLLLLRSTSCLRICFWFSWSRLLALVQSSCLLIFNRRVGPVPPTIGDWLSCFRYFNPPPNPHVPLLAFDLLVGPLASHRHQLFSYNPSLVPHLLLPTIFQSKGLSSGNSEAISFYNFSIKQSVVQEWNFICLRPSPFSGKQSRHFNRTHTNQHER